MAINRAQLTCTAYDIPGEAGASAEVRKLIIPLLNIDSEDYHTLVNQKELTNLNLLKDVSDDEIEKVIQIPQKYTS